MQKLIFRMTGQSWEICLRRKRMRCSNSYRLKISLENLSSRIKIQRLIWIKLCRLLQSENGRTYSRFLQIPKRVDRLRCVYFPLQIKVPAVSGLIKMGRCFCSWRSRRKFLYAFYAMKRQETAIKCM